MKKTPAAKENLLSRLVEKNERGPAQLRKKGPTPTTDTGKSTPVEDVEQAIICRKKSRDSLAMMEICIVKKSMLFQEQR